MRRNKFNSLRKFERLEDRRMMAADIVENGDVLTVTGTDNADLIVIEADPNDADEVLITVRDMANGQILAQFDDEDFDNIDKIVVHALGGNDIVLNTTNARTEMFGEGGNDTLIGGSAVDVMDGGADADTLEGGAGNDILTGGTGNDKYRFVGSLLGNDDVVEAASADVDTLDFTGFAGGVNVNLSLTTEQVVNSANLTLQFSSSSGIENVVGSAFEDVIRGNSRNNELRGEGSRDQLFGGAGADTLLGGTGNDDLFGEGGRDKLNGGADSDYLDGGFDGFDDILAGGGGTDTFKVHRRYGDFFLFDDPEQDITDFISGVDVIFTEWH